MRVITTDYSCDSFIGSNNSVFSLCPLTATSFLAGTADGFINIFDITINGVYTLIPGRKGYWADLNPEPLSRFKGHQAEVSSLALWGNQGFVSGSLDRSICLWQHADGEYSPAQTLGGNSSSIVSIFPFNTNDLIALTANGDILIWSSDKAREPAKAFQSSIGKISSMIKVNSNIFIMGGENCHIMICFLDTKELKTLATYKLSQGLPVRALVACSNTCIAAFKDHIAVIAIPENPSEQYTIKQVILTNNSHPILAALHDDKFASVEQSTNTVLGVHAYDIKIWAKNEEGEYKCSRTLSGHRSKISSIIQLESGHIVSAALNGSIIIWDEEANLQQH
jgi:WD40 repeat protein